MISVHLTFLKMLVGMLRDRDDRGASAIEWAVITAIVIGIATFIAGVINIAVRNHALKIV